MNLLTQVSTELWDRDIDIVGIESHSEPAEYYPAILQCCLTCTIWLPRSQYNLYRMVSLNEELSRSGLTRAYCLVRTLCARPDIACLVNELRLRPRSRGRTIPLVIATGSIPGGWANTMVALRSIHLTEIGWNHSLYYSAISRFPTPTHLELYRVAFDGASCLFRLIWSLPLLTDLALHEVTIRRLSPLKFAELSSICPQSAMDRLTKLSVSVRKLNVYYTFRYSLMLSIGIARRRGLLPTSRRIRARPPAIACCVLVKALVSKYVPLNSHSSELAHPIFLARLRELLLTSTHLEEFEACIIVGDIGTRPGEMCSELICLLSRIAPEKVKLDLRPTSFAKGGYGVCRSEVIDALVSPRTLRTLPDIGYTAHHSSVLDLSLFDETAMHDTVWWSTALSSKPSQCWADIRVRVKQSCEFSRIHSVLSQRINSTS